MGLFAQILGTQEPDSSQEKQTRGQQYLMGVATRTGEKDCSESTSGQPQCGAAPEGGRRQEQIHILHAPLAMWCANSSSKGENKARASTQPLGCSRGSQKQDPDDRQHAPQGAAHNKVDETG